MLLFEGCQCERVPICFFTIACGKSSHIHPSNFGAKIMFLIQNQESIRIIKERKKLVLLQPDIYFSYFIYLLNSSDL